MARQNAVRPRVPRFALLALLALAFARPLQAQPSVASVSPGAVAPGTTLEFQVTGANLAAPLTAWTSFPAKVLEVVPAKDGKSAKVKIQVPANTAPQIGGLVLGGKTGVAEPFAVMVDDLPGYGEAKGNDRIGTAQKLTIPCAIDGKADGVRFDHFQISGVKGQRVSIEVVAHRLGSSMDPVLRLLSASGVEIAAADDTPGRNGDCGFATTLPADGVYTISIHDNQYRSGGRYRLRIGDFPVDRMPHPIGIRRGATTRIVLGDDSRILTAPRTGERIPIGWRSEDGQGSALFECIASELPEFVEREPNDSVESALQVFLPAGVSGVLQKPRDRDWVRFAARKGRTVYIEASSARVGSPSFVMMRVLDTAGKPLAATKVGGNSELSLQFTPPTDGEYGLEIRDLLHRGGLRSTYRVELRDGPDFRLHVKADKAAVTRFAAATDLGAASLTVQCQRRGYEGPIELSLAGEPAGFKLLSNVIPAKATEVRMVIVPTAGVAGDVHLLRLQGSATIEGGQVIRPVTTAALARVKQPAFPYPPAWRDGLIGLAINDPAKPFFTLAGPQKVACAAAGEVKVPLELKRDAKDFKAQVRVLADAAGGITAAVTEAKGKYTLAIKTAGATPVGNYPLTLRTIGEHKGQTHVRTTNLEIQVTETSDQKTAAKE